jgi:hypothetical protein
MSHIEPDDLATLALDGVPPEGGTRAHLDECDACRAEYEALARTVELGRTAASRRELDTPPASVWEAIHAELALAPELAADPFETGAARVATTESLADERPTATITPLSGRSGGSRASAGGSPSDRADAGRRRWWPIAVAAAAVGVMAGVAIGAAATGAFGNRPPPQTVVASAALDAFPGWSTTGSALLEEDADGVRSIAVNLDADVPSTDVREVWLIRSDASGLVSLGLLDGPSGRFVVPDGIDLDEFTLVDVSAEPVDGDPAHSGDSIVRGELRRA